MRILIAADKFKGSMNAAQACAALARGMLKVFPRASVDVLPVADGGEGTAEAICAALAGEWVETNVSDPLGREVRAGYAMVQQDNQKTAVMEMSAASGLWRLKRNERNPLRASTIGTGQMMRHALDAGAKKLLVGIGGSATNDGGSGMAEALGFRFLDASGAPVTGMPQKLETVVRIERPDRLQKADIVAACDVTNPLLGEHGATRVYGPQKGVGPQDIGFQEERLRHLADVVSRDLGCDFREARGTGAAGGLGFGLVSFCGATLAPGFALVAEAIGLEDQVRQACIVITGEGRIDSQTAEGKAPAGVAALARRHGVPVVAFCGSVADDAGLGEVFDLVVSLRRTFPQLELDACLAEGERLLEITAEMSGDRLKKISLSRR